MSKGTACGPWCAAHEKAGADRERRRIRRTQRVALKRLFVMSRPLADGIWRDSLTAIDAATRAKKGKRK